MTYAQINEICKNYNHILNSGERFRVEGDCTGIRLCIVNSGGGERASLRVNSYIHALDTLRFIAKIVRKNQ